MPGSFEYVVPMKLEKTPVGIVMALSGQPQPSLRVDEAERAFRYGGLP